MDIQIIGEDDVMIFELIYIDNFETNKNFTLALLFQAWIREKCE